MPTPENQPRALTSFDAAMVAFLRQANVTYQHHGDVSTEQMDVLRRVFARIPWPELVASMSVNAIRNALEAIGNAVATSQDTTWSHAATACSIACGSFSLDTIAHRYWESIALACTGRFTPGIWARAADTWEGIPTSQPEPVPTPGPRTRRQRPTPAIPGELVTSRRFGVEIELTALRIPDFTTDMTSYSIPFRNTDSAGSGREALTSWTLKRDGSVHGQGLELVSPPLTGVKGLAQLKLVTELVKINGGKVDDSCGLHVHHSAQDLEDKHLKNLLVLWYKYQDLCYGVADPSRQNNRYCQKLAPADFTRLHAMQRGFGAAVRQEDRYKGLNFASLNIHNTVEFRLLEGTLNVRKIEAWVALTQRLVRLARYLDTVEPNSVSDQFHLLGSVTKMLSRNGYKASEEETQAFNLLSSYYHKNKRPANATRRRNLGE